MDTEQLSLFDFYIDEEEADLAITEEDTAEPLVLHEPFESITYPEQATVFTTEELHCFYHFNRISSMHRRFDRMQSSLPAKDKRHLLIQQNPDINFRLFSSIRDGYLLFFESMNLFSGKEVEELKQRLDLSSDESLIYEALYKPTFLVEAFEQLPFINFNHMDEKMHAFARIVLNTLFPYFEKSLTDDGRYTIVFPDDFIAKVTDILTNFPVTPEEIDKVRPEKLNDYFLMNNYVYFITKKIFVFQDDTNVLSNLFHQIDSQRIDWDDDTHTATIDVSAMPLASSTQHYFYKTMKEMVTYMSLMYFLYEAYPLYADLFKADEEFMEDAGPALDEFLAGLEQRLIPLDQIDHKTGVTKAEKAGLTHMFLPFSNRQPLFLSQVPLLVAKQASNDERVMLYPLTGDHYHSLKYRLTYYQGYYDKFPVLSTRSTPHVVGDYYEPGVINEELFNDALEELLETHAPELAHALTITRAIIGQHQLVKNRMEAVYYEEDKQEEDLPTLYDTLYKQTVPVPPVHDIVYTLLTTVDEQPVRKHQVYRIEARDDAETDESYELYVQDIIKTTQLDDATYTIRGLTSTNESMSVYLAENYAITLIEPDHNAHWQAMVLDSVRQTKTRRTPISFMFLDVYENQAYYYQNDEFISARAIEPVADDETRMAAAQAFMKDINEEYDFYDEPYLVPYYIGHYDEETYSFNRLERKAIYIREEDVTDG